MALRKFLVVADDSDEFPAALRYACARARATGGRVTLLRVLEPAVFEHWSGVREEIERQQRAEAEALLQKHAAVVMEATGHPPEFVVKDSPDVRGGIRAVVSEDPEIKILVLAAATHGRGPGPLIAAMAKEGMGHHGRKLPVTIVPGDLTDAEIAELS
jgi:nucleotide-binding universal stress UspA family protein